MKNTHKIAITLWLMIVATAGLYAAGQQITSLTQTVWEGDIMTAAYYNKLNGPKSEGKVCKFVTDKLACLDDMPIWWTIVTNEPSLPGVSTPTIMNKIVISPTKNTPEEKIVEWNTLVDTTYNKWIESPGVKWDQAAIDSLTSGWYTACKIKPSKYTLTLLFWKSWEETGRWCGSFMCGIWLDKWSVNVDVGHCWSGTPDCPKGHY